MNSVVLVTVGHIVSGANELKATFVRSNNDNAMSRYTFLGVNDERDFCECCGKVGLKRVVWIEDTETCEIRHYGTTCATNPAKAFGHKTVSEIRSASANYERRMRESLNQAWWDLRDTGFELYFINAREMNDEGKRMHELIGKLYYAATFTMGEGKYKARDEYMAWVMKAKSDKVERRIRTAA